MSDHQPLHYATGGFIANPERPYIVGEQPQCCLGVFYPQQARKATHEGWGGTRLKAPIVITVR